MQPRTIRVTTAWAVGCFVGALVSRLVGGGGTGTAGLVATLMVAATALALAIIQLTRPYGAKQGVLPGASAVVASAIIATTGSLIAEGIAGPRGLWITLLGASVFASAMNAFDVVRDRTDADQAEPQFVEPGDVPPSVNKESVEVLLGAMQTLIEAEDARAQSLNARAVGLGGFAAVIVALLVPSARDLGDGQGPEPLVASIALIAAAAALLVTGVLVVLLGVVVTRQVSTISLAEIELWETKTFVEKSPTWIRGRLLVTSRKALVSERFVNGRKARGLTTAVVLVAAGILCAAAGALTLIF